MDWQGGNLAPLAADSTQDPVGVPANFPVTLTELTFPPEATLMVAMAVPGTLYWLAQACTLGCTPFMAPTIML